MKDSTKRALRTLVQAIIAAAAAAPVVMSLLPTDNDNILKIEGAVVAGAAIVSKLVNVLEERGLLPEWLKSSSNVGTHEVTDYRDDVA